jgi:TetR/AcrR family transcriptional regulator, transcriptional repressor of bet genes
MRRRIPEEVRRRELVEAALRVAGRGGLAGVTVRAVAAEARVSHSLVLFHFGQKENLFAELLDRLIETMSVLKSTDDLARVPRALDRLHVLLLGEMERIVRHPEHTRLFLEFWALGAKDERLRARIRTELARYRAAFLALIDEVLHSEAAFLPGATAEGFSAVAVSWIQGCAMQALIDPEHFDVDAYRDAVRRVLVELTHGARLAPAPRA